MAKLKVGDLVLINRGSGEWRQEWNGVAKIVALGDLGYETISYLEAKDVREADFSYYMDKKYIFPLTELGRLIYG